MAVRDLGNDLMLRGVDDAPVLDSDPALAPAQWLIHEWREYVVEWQGGVERRPPIELHGLPRYAWRAVGGAAVFGFQNQLGLARFEIRAGGNSLPLTLEVLSPKYPTAAAHRAFYEPLVQQLSSWAAALPFSLDTPTALRVAESIRQRSDLFAWHFLRENSPAILEALQSVLQAPRRVLALEHRAVGIDQGVSLDPSSLVEIVRRPNDLLLAQRGAAAYGWALAGQLEQRGSGRRFLPARIRATEAEETLDTPEHRFVRAFLEELSNTADRLLRRLRLPEDGNKLLRGFRGEVQEALHSTFLAEVGLLKVFPWASRVLQRAFGYRELLQAWRAFQLAADPFESLDRALDARDVATLYEWWCFYALIEHVAALTGFRSLSPHVDDLLGLRPGLHAAFGDGWALTFNPTFSPGGGAWHSYSVPLRPDFVLSRDNEPLVALDAKFRFEFEDWRAAGDPADQGEAGADIALAANSEPRRVAKQADLYKMHAYRDALGLRCCVVLYPGSGRDGARFYGADRRPVDRWSLARLLEDPPLSGVGSLPLTPDCMAGRRSSRPPGAE